MAIDNIEKAIFDILSSDEDIDSLIGKDGEIVSISHSHFDDIVYPSIHYTLDDSPYFYSQDGDTGLYTTRTNLTILANSDSDCIELSGYVLGVINGYSGTVGTVDIQYIYIMGMYDIPDISDTQEKTLFGKTILADIFYNK